MKGGKYNYGAVGYAFAIAEQSDLTPHQFAALITIAAHWDTRTSDAYPSIDRLTQITGISRASMHRAIKGLEEKGLIDVSKRKGAGKKYTHNVYRLPGYTPKRERAASAGTPTFGTPQLSRQGQPQTAGFFT